MIYFPGKDYIFIQIEILVREYQIVIKLIRNTMKLRRFEQKTTADIELGAEYRRY